MEVLSAIAAVRKRPGMYVGDTADGRGIVSMVLEVVANAVDQYLIGRCSAVGVKVTADGTVIVQDDGPGMLAGGGGGQPPLDWLLTAHSDRPTVDGHRPHVHLGIGGLGLFVVNALSERFELVTVRDGLEARVAYTRGELAVPLTTTTTQLANGTSIRFRPDPMIFNHARCSRTELSRKLEDLAFLASGLRIAWSFDSDDVAAHGLVGRVAAGAHCAYDHVARHRSVYETANGPIDVEVALAWRQPHTSPSVIESFVNLARTPGDGAHVDGLLDGIREFLGCARPRIDNAGLVASVAVILTDVIYGNPTKDRLDSPAARAPVSAATVAALTAWAVAHSDAAAAIKLRHA